MIKNIFISLILSLFLFGSANAATLTVYPDANPETSSVDGIVYQNYGAGRDTWTNLVNAAGSHSSDTTTQNSISYCLAELGVTDHWVYLIRAPYLFDTSSLPDSATISAATMSVWGTSKADTLSASPSLNVYSSAPASDTALVPGDYDSFGTTAYATKITYSSWSTSGYNDFTINATGIAAISKTGITKFGLREADYDAPDSAPTWSSNKYWDIQGRFVDYTGTSNDPKLVITYTTGKRRTGVVQ